MGPNFQLPEWTSRTFNFGFDADFIPFFVERLSSTAPRMAEIMAAASEEQLSYRRNGKWSAKEHFGHLGDLEDLHMSRLGDFRSRAGMLRAADMSNRKTVEGGHNSAAATTLLLRFREARENFFEKLRALDSTELQHLSMHPRLNVMINVADMLYFMAEHDTHHLTIVSGQLPASF